MTAYLEAGYRESSMQFIITSLDLRNDSLVKKSGSFAFRVANDAIRSIRFNRPNFRIDDPDLPGFDVRFCEDPGLTGKCAEVSQEDLDETAMDTLLGGVPDWDNLPKTQPLKKEISSFSFGGDGKARQAGVILYNKDNFKGGSEIFIASDRKLDNDNLISWDRKQDSPVEHASSIRIIGKYIVTLYDGPRYEGNFIQFDNTVDPPEISQGIMPGDPVSTTSLLAAPQVLIPQPGILEIPLLSAFPHPDSGKTWNDKKVKSIQLSVPREIWAQQELTPLSAGCDDLPTKIQPNEWCVLP